MESTMIMKFKLQFTNERTINYNKMTLYEEFIYTSSNKIKLEKDLHEIKIELDIEEKILFNNQNKITYELETNYIKQNKPKLIVNYHLINDEIKDDINETINEQNINKIIHENINTIRLKGMYADLNGWRRIIHKMTIQYLVHGNIYLK